MSNNELRVLIDKLNGFCKTSLEASAGSCLSRSHFYVEIEHWFLKILEENTSDFHQIFSSFDINHEKDFFNDGGLYSFGSNRSDSCLFFFYF